MPSPLKFFGRIVGTPDELTYYKDIVRYFDALDKASNRITVFRIGKSEEGRDMIVAAIADEATIKSLDKYKKITAQLTDPRKITEAEARQLIATEAVYWATGACTRRDGQREIRWSLLSADRRGDAFHPEQRTTSSLC